MRKMIALSAVVALAGIFTLATATTAQRREGGAFRGFRAQLTGDEQVPALDTAAMGNAVVRVTSNGVAYTLVVNNAVNVVATHIHCAPAGVNGPIGVTLFAGGPVTTNGVLAQGPILAPDVNNACGWVDLDDLVAAMESGDTYVNVHTLANLPGEIRGQLR